MRVALVALLLVTLVSGCSGHDPAGGSRPRGGSAATVPVPAAAQTASVVRNVDGDTVVLRGRGAGPLPQAPTKVRLLLIDTPEVFGRQECFGEQASRRTEQLLPPGSQVRVQADRDLLDRYGRTLLQIWTADGANVNQVLLAEGYATVLVVKPNVAYLQQFSRAEQTAHEAGVGLWAACR